MKPAPHSLAISVGIDNQARVFRVSGPARDGGAPRTCEYRVAGPDQNAYLDFFAELARDFGTRLPRNRSPREWPLSSAPYRPLLTRNLSADIRYGYGDPAMLRVDGGYYLVATSNDAPHAFPIVRSSDLEQWEPVGFVFPEGTAPAWTASGENVGDFWAPELHRVGGEYWLCFAARAKDRSLAIGMAKAPSPDGPFVAADRPLLGGGVIDPHLFVDADGSAWLFWKEDSNGVWPSLLAALLHRRPELIDELFAELTEARTAAVAAALWPWAATLEPMERFFLFQPLVETIVSRFSEVRERLARVEGAEPLLQAMRTPVFAQRLAADGLSLVGNPTVVLVNDLDWEGHLIEGMWLTRQDGRFYLFYSGNDFSTADYGIGVAVADSPLGPFRKREQPLLRSSPDWWAPGHPSVAQGPDGQPHLFLHAFVPGQAGYKIFRALLTVGLRFEGDEVRVTAPAPALRQSGI